MRVLVIGSGVLGSVYAAKLQASGHSVKLLARGGRVQELREQGIVLVNADSGEEQVVPVSVIETLDVDDRYDLVLVVVKKNQLSSVLPMIARNVSANILFMVNNPSGPEELIAALGSSRVILGFPGAGGTREGHAVRYRQVSGATQPTTIGELDGSQSERIRHIADALRQAGFNVAVSRHMDAWLKTHVALVSPIANAIYMAVARGIELKADLEVMRLLVRAVKEGLRVLHALHIPVEPSKYRLLQWVPEGLIIRIVRPHIGTPQWELTVVRHAMAARDEMKCLSDEFQCLVQRSGIPTPALNKLHSFC